MYNEQGIMKTNRYCLPEDKITNYLTSADCVTQFMIAHPALNNMMNGSNSYKITKSQLCNDHASPLILNQASVGSLSVFVYDDSYRQSQRWSKNPLRIEKHPDIYWPEEIHIVRISIYFGHTIDTFLQLLNKIYFEEYFKEFIWQGAYEELQKYIRDLNFGGEFKLCIQSVYTKSRIEGVSKDNFIKYAEKRFNSYFYKPEANHKSEDINVVNGKSIVDLLRHYNFIESNITNDEISEMNSNILQNLKFLDGFPALKPPQHVKHSTLRQMKEVQSEKNQKQRKNKIDLDVKVRIKNHKCMVITIDEAICSSQAGVKITISTRHSKKPDLS
jgi:hypothetical protein